MAGNGGICRFGSERLRPRLRAFNREIDGVRAGTDPEYVHRMRVASRRLRSTLPLFSECFPGRKYRRWLTMIRTITRALGRARDTDVQLAFLEAYVRELPGSAELAGIDRIRTFLENMRRQEQETILSALDALDRKGTLGDIASAVRGKGRESRHGGAGQPYGNDVYGLARVKIDGVLATLLSYEMVVHDPDDISGHHAMRIAAKRLRYTLEVFRPLYLDHLRPAIRSLKKLQEILGELHDCDIWIQLLSGDLDPAKNGTGTCRRTGRKGTGVRTGDTGVSPLLLNRRERRQELYRNLVSTWETCGSDAVWDRLRAGIRTVPVPDDLPHTAGSPQFPMSAATLGALAGIYPEGLGHAQQVARLALMLFDGLVDLHGYGIRERRLLSVAGRLHDIGWAYGQKGHHTRSCRMILDDRSLPVTQRERSIIALIARYHRKALPGPADPLFSELRRKDRQRVGVLSALLRIADGLDYTHENHVKSLACSISPSAVTCVVDDDGDAAIERARALQKSDLFRQVFERTLVIA